MDQMHLLSRAWELTQAIEQAALLADWPTAARLVEQRSPLLMSLSASQSADAIATIRRIQAIDAAIMSDAEITRCELQSEFQAALRSTEAAHRYQQMAHI